MHGDPDFPRDDRARARAQLGDAALGTAAAGAASQLVGTVLRVVGDDAGSAHRAGGAFLTAGLVLVVAGVVTLLVARFAPDLSRLRARGSTRVLAFGGAVVGGIVVVAAVTLALDGSGSGPAPAATRPSPTTTATTTATAAPASTTTAAATATSEVSPGAVIAAQGLRGGSNPTPTIASGVTFPNGDSSRRGSTAVTAAPWGGQVITPESATEAHHDTQAPPATPTTTVAG